MVICKEGVRRSIQYKLLTMYTQDGRTVEVFGMSALGRGQAPGRDGVVRADFLEIRGFAVAGLTAAYILLSCVSLWKSSEKSSSYIVFGIVA